MTNEEKILEKLDILTEEIREAKRAVQPYMELKEDLQPLINEMVAEAITKLSGLDRQFELEDIGDMMGQLLVSSKNLTEAMKTLNRIVEFKNDFEPYSKEMFKELVERLQHTLHGFEPEKLQELIKQFVINMGTLADMIKMLGSIMEFKKDAGALSQSAFNELIVRLDCLQQKGVFQTAEQLVDVTQRVGARLQEIDFQQVEPVRGVFGMLAALRRPEVQEGLGIMIELATVMTALKEPSGMRECGNRSAST
ncbi:DUF1641 domain-containing protein [Desulfolithobacter sp.]